MLSSEHRLIKKEDFSGVYTKGRSYASDLVVVYILPNHISKLRIGFSVSKKVGKAVVRNRVKRLMGEAVKHLIPLIKSECDLVFVARAKSCNADFHSIYKSIEILLKKSGVIKQESIS
ncbi:MAG: ribonuclease P protein component [Armatimonadota bacterium]